MKRHLMNFSGAIIIAVTYGYEVTSEHDPILGRVRQLMAILELELPSERAVSMTAFPLLSRLPAWIPGLGFKRKSAESRQLLHDIKNIPFNYAKKQMAAGTATNSMVADFFLSQEGAIDPHLEDTMKDTAAAMFLGGTDTTSAVLYVFILAMVLYPDVQHRAQAEIDALLGSDTIPGFEHRESLPYVEAVVRETLRWHPVAPLGLPHVSTADDTYNGYYIPKGAVMVFNTWAMSHNTIDFNDPGRFNPDRYFLSDGKLSPNDAVLNSPSFGFGRRICPGRFFADASTWVAITTMLATLRFAKAFDVNGCEVEVKPEFTTGAIVHPAPFRCSITGRHSAREKEIRAALKSL
ncbi:cytochrome P450 [Hygrophoropsis aurantiaca]|uniref:Cytochrome P450 n=1 Tax=Hygrophoropsis aurantiaca TaxID=72124 RepID=A0ACB8AJW2_9AGAM|nr:cytochrome P450 [Hygrophoropsis aurantiaca]